MARTLTRRSVPQPRHSTSWSRMTGQQRGAILFRAAEIVSARIDSIAMDMTNEMGKPFRESRLEVARGVDTLRFYAGEGWRPQGEIFSQTATEQPYSSVVQTARRRRADHSVEFSVLDTAVEVCPRPGVWQHGRTQSRP